MNSFRSIRSLAVMLCLLGAFGCASARHTKPSTPIVQDHFAEIERPDVPLTLNNQVQDWIDFFQGRGRDRFEKYLARSGRYIPMMRKILKEHGLPENLVYLSMIESGFNPHAYSRARATGAWQFMYRTGIRYGLRVDSWIDERRDPEKSTVAAAKYLKDLYDRFNDWYLAAAGYNAGEGKVGRAIRKYATEDFWALARGRYLRAETRNYVPKLIAAALISMQPEKYGFSHVIYEEPVRYDEVTLTLPLDLRVAARCSHATYEELRALNPGLIRWMTPPDSEDYVLRIPVGSSEKFWTAYTDLKPGEILGDRKITIASRTSILNLARKKKIPPLLLAAANGLSPDDVVGPKNEVILPYDPPDGESYRERVYERSRGKRSRAGKGSGILYIVRNGDHIGRVSAHTGISVAALKRYNTHVNWSSLRSGQKIRLYASTARYESSKKKIVRRTKTSASHQKRKSRIPPTQAASIIP